MRSLLTLLLLVFFSNSTIAENINELTEQYESDENSGWAMGLGFEGQMTPELSDSADYEIKNIPSLFLSYSWDDLETQTEISRTEKSTAEGDYAIKTQRGELRQWLLYHIPSQLNWRAHLGVSVGVYQQRIESRFFQNVSRVKSDPELMGGAELGGQGPLFKKIFAEVNLRALRDSFDLKTKDPWVWALQAKLGYRF